MTGVQTCALRSSDTRKYLSTTSENIYIFNPLVGALAVYAPALGLSNDARDIWVRFPDKT